MRASSQVSIETHAAIYSASLIIIYKLVKTIFTNLPRIINGAIYQSFIIFIAGLCIRDKNQSAHGIVTFFGLNSHDALTRMLSHKCWSANLLMLELLNQAIQLSTCSFKQSWLILDDVILAKQRSRNTDGVYWDWDYVNRRHVLCMRFVVLAWSNGIVRIPVAFALYYKRNSDYLIDYHKKFRTKNQIARALIYQVIRQGLRFDYLLFDSWYASADNFKLFNRLNIVFVAGLKSNRKLRLLFNPIANKPKRKRKKLRWYEFTCSQLAAQHPYVRDYHYYKKVAARVRQSYVFVEGLDFHLKMVCIKNYAKNKAFKDIHTKADKKEKDPNKYLITNDISLTIPQTIQLYRLRWAIEVIFRDCKQQFALGKHQAYKSIEPHLRHTAMVFFAYSFLELMKANANLNLKIGATCGQIRCYLQNQQLVYVNGHYHVVDISKINWDWNNVNQITELLDLKNLSAKETQLVFNFKN